MTVIKRSAAFAAVSLTAVLAFAPAAHAARPGSGPRIEVCFVLDTTGSMGGLIEGAKLKIWSIANRMVAAKPAPQLKVALIGYRDRGDEYVTRRFDLSDDIDAVYANLQKFQAGGGGDTPESVNQALHEAVTAVSWSADRDVLKIVFIVGDCPPHLDYPNDVQYPESCREAVRRDIIVNTVQCGAYGETAAVWQEIARLAEGRYVAIGQEGGMVATSTPLDGELATLNRELGGTLVAYGAASRRDEVRAKQAAAEAAPAPAMADRLEFNSVAKKAVQGAGDLVGDVASGRVALSSVRKEELPEEIKDRPAAEQEAYLKGQAAKRAGIQAKIDRLLAERRAYLDAENKRLAAAGKGNAFDDAVAAMLQSQAARKGIAYGR
jgi:hypothetical protein